MNFLGIDGGGSRTRFLLNDAEDREVARCETGPSNWISVGQTEARRALADGIAQLPFPPDVVCAGLAGAARHEGRRIYSETLRELLPRARVFVETDAFIAYVGAIGIRTGVLLIAGTGSIAIGRRSDGRMVRAGGWGPAFGDEGSGYWIGREAVRAALRCHDTGQAPEFVDSIARALGLPAVTDAVSAWAEGRIGVPQVASLAEELLRQCPAEPSRRIVSEASIHLRTILEIAALKVADPDCPRSISGSLGANPVMRELIGSAFQPPLQPPERGAVTWARAQASH